MHVLNDRIFIHIHQHTSTLFLCHITLPSFLIHGFQLFISTWILSMPRYPLYFYSLFFFTTSIYLYFLFIVRPYITSFSLFFFFIERKLKLHSKKFRILKVGVCENASTIFFLPKVF